MSYTTTKLFIRCSHPVYHIGCEECLKRSEAQVQSETDLIERKLSVRPRYLDNYQVICSCGAQFYNAADHNQDEVGDVFCSPSCAETYGEFPSIDEYLESDAYRKADDLAMKSEQ